MVGFTCYVSGKFDPSEFFYGLQLNFDAPPHMVQLRSAVESRVMSDKVLPDGAEYFVQALEILDMRINLGVPLDNRHQLYSGCHVTAIRDAHNATAAGPIDNGNRRAEEKIAALSCSAQQLFDIMDYDNSGVVSMKSMLRVLRHDVNYAIDLFSAVDDRSTGRVTFQDFMTVYHRHSTETWRELHTRLQHGGRLPVDEAAEDGNGRREDYISRRDEAAGVEGGGATRFGSPMRRINGGGGVLDLSRSPMSTRMDLLSPGAGAEVPAGGTLETVTLADIRTGGVKKAAVAGASPPKIAVQQTGSVASAGSGGGASPTATALDDVAAARAKSVVDMFKSSVNKRPASKIGQRVLAAARELKRRGNTPPASSPVASPASPSLSTTQKAVTRSPTAGTPGMARARSK